MNPSDQLLADLAGLPLLLDRDVAYKLQCSAGRWQASVSVSHGGAVENVYHGHVYDTPSEALRSALDSATSRGDRHHVRR